MTTYTFHHDDGHGWLEVPYQDMMNVGVTLEDVSRFSYATVVNYRPTVFLEEDIDVAVFMLAAKRAGKDIKFNHVRKKAAVKSAPTHTTARASGSTALR
jgi:hypothetical protein